MGLQSLKFEIGCDFEEFKTYYESIFDKLSNTEAFLVKQNPEHLIVWRENNLIVGHAIWHEASTDKHRKGEPRNKDDKAILRELFEGKTKLVELHEVWLKKEYRGQGYGNHFFAFFEEFMRQKQYTNIAYYAYHPAALSICRTRGYKEACCLQQPGIEGNIETTHIFRIEL